MSVIPQDDDFDPQAVAKQYTSGSFAAPVSKQPHRGLDVPGTVDDELEKLGYPETSRLAILGNLGRENAWNAQTIFGGHNDPANSARNRGLMSWQGDRRTNLENFVSSNGGDWTPTEQNIRLQTQFLDNELRSKYPKIHNILTDPNTDLPTASRRLRDYINYVPVPPYNTPDPVYDTVNNRRWAEEAQRRGLAQFSPDKVADQYVNDPSLVASHYANLAAPAADPVDAAPPVSSPAPPTDDQGRQFVQPGSVPSVAPTPTNPAVMPSNLAPPAAPAAPANLPAILSAAPIAAPATPAPTSPISPAPPVPVPVPQAPPVPHARPIAQPATAPATTPAPVAKNYVGGEPVISDIPQTPATATISDRAAAAQQQNIAALQEADAKSGKTWTPELINGRYYKRLDDGGTEKLMLGGAQAEKLPTSNEAIADTITVPQGLNEEQANHYVRGYLQAKYGADPDALAKGQFLTPYTGAPVSVTYGDLKNLGVNTEPLLSQKVAENRTENPQPDLRVGRDFTKDDADHLRNVFGDRAGTGLAALAAIGGKNAQMLGGLVRIAEMANPVTGAQSSVLGKQAPSYADDVYRYLTETGDSTQRIVDASGKKVLTYDENGRPKLSDDMTSMLEKKGIEIGGDLLRLYTMGEALPGTTSVAGKMAAGATLFGTQSALETAGQGATPGEIAKQTAKGAAVGGLFGVAPSVGEVVTDVAGTLANKAVPKLFTEGVTLGTIAGGSAAIAKLSGDSNEQAVQQAIINSLFHVGPQVIGKTVELVKNAHERIKARVSDTGEVTVAPDDAPVDTTVEMKPDGSSEVLDATTDDIRKKVAPPNIPKTLRPAVDEQDYHVYGNEIAARDWNGNETDRQSIPKHLRPDADEVTRLSAALDAIDRERYKDSPSATEDPEAFARWYEAHQNDPINKRYTDLVNEWNDKRLDLVQSVITENTKIPEATTSPATVTHPNPEIDGKPIIAETQDGRVIVPNENNKAGVSIVTNRTPEENRDTLPANGRPGATDNAGGSDLANSAGQSESAGNERGQQQLREPRAPAGQIAQGTQTEVRVPDTKAGYKARYAIREADDVVPSHNPFNFQPNDKYYFTNDRHYDKEPQYQEQVRNRSQADNFDPAQLINNNPTSETGPPIIDSDGNVLGGNSRSMMVHRIFEDSNPAAREKYLEQLRRDSHIFGIDPQELERFKKPVLVREIDDNSIAPQAAITELNKSSTTALTPAERSIAESRRMSPEALDYISGKIESTGADATLTDALNLHGTDIVNRMIEDGVFSGGERNVLLDKSGKITADGKKRIERILNGQIFEDLDQLEYAPPYVKRNMERAIAPLVKVQGDTDWNILPQTREAIDLLTEYKAKGARQSLDEYAQTPSMAHGEWSPESIAIAKVLQQSPNNVSRAFKTYAGEHATAQSGGGLFGSSTPEQAFDAAFGKEAAKPEPLKAGDTVRDGSRIGQVYERGGDLRVKYEADDGRTQSEPLSDTWKKTANPEAGAVSTDLLTLGIPKFLKEDVGPTAKEVGTTLRDSADDIKKLVFAGDRGDIAHLAGGTLRAELARAQRSYDQAEHALKDARNYFAKQPIEDNYDFIGKIEGGDIASLPENEQPMAKTLRSLLDTARKDVQGLGKGKLESFIENYFPHIWEDPNKASSVFARIFGKKPFEGPKSFLKQRTHDTFAAGLEAGLKPISDNPVDLTLLKIKEMQRYVAAHRTLNDLKDRGLAVFVKVGDKAPDGFTKINDKISDVYAPPTMQMTEYVDKRLYEGMSRLAEDLGITHERLVKAGRGVIGYSEQGGDRIVSQYATGERVVAHEIGHQLDYKYDLVDRFINNPDADLRRDLKKELRTLADSKQASYDRPEGHRTTYTRKKPEQIAHILEAYVNDREQLRSIAPHVYHEFENLIDEHPELEPIRSLQRSLGNEQLVQDVSRGGLVKTGNYYAAEQAATILNNHLSPGLRDRSSAYRAWMAAGNTLNQFQLGFSAFHLGFTSVDAMVSKFALALNQAASLKPIKAIRSAIETPLAPLANILRGRKVVEEWKSPNTTDPLTQSIANLAVEAGARVKMDSFYKTKVADNMVDAFKRGNILGGLARLPFGAVDIASRPIMEYIVPRQKLGIFADLAKHEIDRLGPEATPDQVRRSMGRIWDSVDNRMGQMVYDNLFWNHVVKDLSMASVRSVGWNLGTLRELGGGAKDIVTSPLRIKKALAGDNTTPVVTERMAYVAALPIVTGTLGAMINYLYTGEKPKDLKDYFFPRTGNLDENGKPERLSLPSYMKDVYAYYNHPVKTVGHKTQPLINLITEMLENEDYYGNKIRNEDDPYIQQMADLAKHVGTAATPFAVQGYMRERQREGSITSKGLPFIGLTLAPSDINKSLAEEKLSEILGERTPATARTKEQAARANEMRDLVRKVKKGQDIQEEFHRAAGVGILNPTDLEKIQSRASSDWFTSNVNKLPLTDALNVYEVSTPEEQAKLKDILQRKLARNQTPVSETDKGKIEKFGFAPDASKAPRAPRQPTSGLKLR